MAPKAAKASKAPGAPKTKAAKAARDPSENVQLHWDNLEECQKEFDLTEEEAVAALTEILGPPPDDL